MVHLVSFLVGGLGPAIDRFTLHLFAALAEKERAMISAGALCEARGTEAGSGA
jgi:hypothetical protein